MQHIDVDNIRTALKGDQDPIKEAIKNAIKSSCSIRITTPDDYATGSGFHIGNGYIATVAHNVKFASETGEVHVDVSFDGIHFYKTKTITYNEDDDTAIIKAIGMPDIPSVELGDSDSLEVGDIIAVIGTPEGWHDTATVGRVTNVHQNIGDKYAPSKAWNDMIFIDAQVLGGNSGGEMIATDGKVYGIVMGITGFDSEQGLGQNSIIPINKLKKLISPMDKPEPPEYETTNISPDFSV